MNPHIMIVDDEEAIRESLQGVLEDEDYVVSCAASGEEAIARFRKRPVDCILLDIWMPGIDGLETMNRLHQMDHDVPIIMMSGHATVDTAVQATRQGAFDFLEKPLSSDKLLILLRNVLQKRKLERENLGLRQNMRERSRTELIGKSRLIERTRQLIRRVAASDTPVLILGEHGTGKAIAARMIHQLSQRAEAPLVELNIAGIPEAQVASELFGHEKGAFPGALHKQIGRFEQAHQGILFMDELADAPVGIQARILRAMQERRITRLGLPMPIPNHVRVIAASAYDPELLIRQGRLREDVYYRLNIVTITLPPLRDYLEDFALLSSTLAAEQVKSLGGEPISFSDDMIKLLKSYTWPGNIRELRNYIERCHILLPGEEITPENMPPLDGVVRRATAGAAQENTFNHASFNHAREAFERNYLYYHLQKNHWNIKRTSEELGMERSQLYRKIKAYELVQDEEV
ncbi:MAG: sigma-54 dependent transcriptional regulator [Mariprofundaceae bacterium]|nr:sigma-54 dependent transcriptional regulator [Mariprofundaceae bacterium]